jgi:hypothetical protein
MNRSSLFFGLVLIAVGTLFLLDQFDMVDAWPLVADWWPTVVILAGLTQAVTRPRNPVGGAVVATVGFVLLLWTLGVTEGIALLWPVLIIGLGLWLLFGRGWSRSHWDDAVEVVALFDDRRAAPTGSFSGGEIVTVFGDAAMDLRDVTPDSPEPTLLVTTVFGDVTLTIPGSWDVRVSGPEIFGDVSLEGPIARENPSAVLRLRVVTIFGDVRVRTVAQVGSFDPGSSVGSPRR